jgi:hypothetical protein
MLVNVVENAAGKARVKWQGALLLFAGLYSACGLIPAAGMWLASGDTKLAGTALAVGFSIACCTLPILVLQQLRLPIDRLPSQS